MLKIEPEDSPRPNTALSPDSASGAFPVSLRDQVCCHEVIRIYNKSKERDSVCPYLVSLLGISNVPSHGI